MDIEVIAKYSGAILTGIAVLMNTILFYKEKKSRNDQSFKVSGWINEDDPKQGITICTVSNTSSEPVYNVVITPVIISDISEDGRQVRINDELDGAIIELLPPGSYKVQIPIVCRGMCKAFNIEMAFTDCKRRMWVKSGLGITKRIWNQTDPINYYKITKPVSYAYLETVEK